MKKARFFIALLILFIITIFVVHASLPQKDQNGVVVHRPGMPKMSDLIVPLIFAIPTACVMISAINKIRNMWNTFWRRVGKKYGLKPNF